ncbi:MAG TPA: MotA/TolQ/ExbB proton channel family protein [Planctomycetota bacterium]|nr:MotA/TolQ/ExbB proton channel family protein [Planctomycetota bacterium]
MQWRKWIVPLLMVAFMLVLVGGTAWAEGAAPAHAEGKKTLWELFKSTGVVGIVIVLLSVAGVAMAIQYGMELREQNVLPPYMVQEIDQLVEEEDYEGAAALCEKGESYFAKILLAGFQAVGVGDAHAPIEAMELAATEETFKLNAKISYINLIGNLGPLVGLLGTVTGMISSFQVIATLKSPTPKDLAEGVYESLVNTTMGLAIALGFLTVFFIYKNKIQKLTLQSNSIAHDVLKRVASH